MDETYNAKVVKKYEKFVGKHQLLRLLKLFSLEKFAGKWSQVMCSPSTSLLGSGVSYSSVQAKYTLKKNNVVGVRNDAYDNHLNRVSITGTSEARVECVPTCRNIEFNNLFRSKGDYWIIDATPSFNTILIAAPLCIKVFNEPIIITNTLGCYVLTKNTVKEFWDSTKEHEYIFHSLEKYGFTKLWNKPLATPQTYEL
jgi:lipocalin